MRRRWDYLVRYLAGGIPPNESKMKIYSKTMKVIRVGPDRDD